MVTASRLRRIACLIFIGVMMTSPWGCAKNKSTVGAPSSLPGLATGTSVITQFITPPSVRNTIDALESTIIAIRLSNTALLHMPMTDSCQWPVELSRVPSNETLLKMGISGAVMSQGQSIAFEKDPKTGLPRPTSPLYLMLKEKEALLKKAKRPGRNAHRNALLAFGVVSLNNKEVRELEHDLIANERGFTRCQGLIRSDNKTFQRGIREKFCDKKALRVMQNNFSRREDLASQKETRDMAKGKFAPLAKNVSRVTLAGMDYLGAALAQMTGAILKIPSAINNAKNEFRRLPPHEVAMMVSRLENIKRIAPYFPQQVSDHISIYKTLYNVLKDEYPDDLDEEEKKTAQQVLDRVLAVETAYDGIREKIAALSRGENIHFSANEEETWARLAALFPSEEYHPDLYDHDSPMMIALNFTTQETLFEKEEIQQ